jgi:hypothetical protein
MTEGSQALPPLNRNLLNFMRKVIGMMVSGSLFLSGSPINTD